MSNLLFDTNAIIDWFNGNSQVVELARDANKFVSFVTEIELYADPNGSVEERKKIQHFLSDFHILHLPIASTPIAELKELTAQIRRNHRKLNIPDALIAATVISNSLTLVTADKGFKQVNGLLLVSFEPLKPY